jgi:Fe-S oxidoreductase
MIDQAKEEMARSMAALRPVLDGGGYVVGLEPSCILTFRDEAPRLFDDWDETMGKRVMLFEEFIAAEHDAGRFDLPLAAPAPRALLHGHCHQKAHAVMGPVETVLGMIPGFPVETIDSSCCGMAGAFGYQAETAAVSRDMAELSLAPAVRDAPGDALIVADGTSCRHQITDLTDREALHVARVLDMASEAAR